jgi:hypothetical protein
VKEGMHCEQKVYDFVLKKTFIARRLFIPALTNVRNSSKTALPEGIIDREVVLAREK